MSGFYLISRRNQLCLKSPLLALDIWSPSLGTLPGLCLGSVVHRCAGGGNQSAKWAKIRAPCSVQKVQDTAAVGGNQGSGSSR